MKFRFSIPVLCCIILGKLLLLEASSSDPFLLCVRDLPSAVRPKSPATPRFGRVSNDEFILTPQQIEKFHREGCITVPDVLTEKEVVELESVFDRFVSGEIPIPAKVNPCFRVTKV